MTDTASTVRSDAAGRILPHLLLIGASVVVLGPFIWIAAAAFKTQISLLLGQVLFDPVLFNFRDVLFSRSSPYLQNFGNSLIVASVSTAVVLTVSFLSAYSLQRMSWPRWIAQLLLLWALVFQMIPPVTLAGAWYEMFRSVGLRNAYIALTLSHITLHIPMALWLLSAFIREVPREIEEAAYVDGCSFWALLWRVVLPIVAPGVVSTGILVFIFSWNEFAIALTLTDNRTATVPVAIAKFAQENEIKYTQMAAASVLSALPALVALLLGQKYIVKGLTAGAVK